MAQNMMQRLPCVFKLICNVSRIANLIANSMQVSSESPDEKLEDDNHVEDEDADKETMSKKQDEISLAEKMHLLWNSGKPDLEKDDAHVNLHQIDAVDDDDAGDGYAITHYPEAWQFLTGSHAYYWLLARVRTEMLLTKRDRASEAIKREIMRGLASRPKGYAKAVTKAKFYVYWSLRTFLKEKYPDEQSVRLGSLITMIASGDDVQALTCAQYMGQVWPVTGPETLSAVQGALDTGPGQAYKGISNPILIVVIMTYRLVAIMMDKTRIALEVNDSTIVAVVKGTEPAIAEIGQQLAWLGAALRSSPSEQMTYSTPRVTLSNVTEAIFAFDFQVREFVHQEPLRNGSCWRPLFRNPVIVEGYPILARANGEKGLEISLNMMAGLGEASRVTNFDGGLVIKGYSTMFCPTERIKNSVLWHYLFNHDGNRMSYLSPDTLCRGRVPIHEVDMACLEYSRNFLGWASNVEVHIGEPPPSITLQGPNRAVERLDAFGRIEPDSSYFTNQQLSTSQLPTARLGISQELLYASIVKGSKRLGSSKALNMSSLPFSYC